MPEFVDNAERLSGPDLHRVQLRHAAGIRLRAAVRGPRRDPPIGSVRSVGQHRRWHRLRSPHAPDACARADLSTPSARGLAKLGKTEKGAVWITADRSSPYTLHQFLINLSDEKCAGSRCPSRSKTETRSRSSSPSTPNSPGSRSSIGTWDGKSPLCCMVKTSAGRPSRHRNACHRVTRHHRQAREPGPTQRGCEGEQRTECVCLHRGRPAPDRPLRRVVRTAATDQGWLPTSPTRPDRPGTPSCSRWHRAAGRALDPAAFARRTTGTSGRCALHRRVGHAADPPARSVASAVSSPTTSVSSHTSENSNRHEPSRDITGATTTPSGLTTRSSPRIATSA